MKCPEAVEWMHRYIDHDLNEEESSVLFEHMRVCADCAEKFALLSELSAKLEGLPKVTPRFSIVDSILPELDEIDRARQEGSAAAADPATMVPLKQDGEPGLGERSQRPARSRNRAYRTGALGLAAAVLLGVFIYQYEPKTIPNAEVESQVAYDSASSTADKSTFSEETADSSRAGQPLAKQDSNANMDSSPAAEATEPSAGDMKSAQSAGNAGRETEVPQDSGESGQKVGGSSGNTAPAQEGNSAPAQKSQDGSGGGAESSQTSTNPGKADNYASLTKPNEAGDRQGEPSSGGNEPKMEKAPLAAEDPGMDFKAADIMGITSFPKNQWSSPDGTYLAELTEGHLYIYRNDADQRVTLKNETVTGNWVKGEWSEDGRSFTYETEKDGVSNSYTLTVRESGTGAGGNSSSNQP